MTTGITGPEVVEDPRSVGELGLDVMQVRAHADVGVEEDVLSLVVRHPALVEEHVRARQPELVGQTLRLDGDTHLGISGFGWCRPMNNKRSRGTLTRASSTARIKVSGSNQL